MCQVWQPHHFPWGRRSIREAHLADESLKLIEQEGVTLSSAAGGVAEPARKDCGWEGFLEGRLSENSPEAEGCRIRKMALVDRGNIVTVAADQALLGAGQRGVGARFVDGSPCWWRGEPALSSSGVLSQVRGRRGGIPWPPGPLGHWRPSTVAWMPEGRLAHRCVLIGGFRPLALAELDGTLPAHPRSRVEAPCSPALGTVPCP